MQGLYRQVFLLFLGVFAVFSVVSVARAQYYSCTPCCAGGVRTCRNLACTNSCTETPACVLGAVTNLTYSGYGTNNVNLFWSSATSAAYYRVLVDQVGGATIVDDNVTGTNYGPITLVPGAQYTWSITPYTNCAPGTPVSGGTIGVPNGTTSSVMLARGEAATCTNTACNARDIMVGLDANHNQVIPVRVTAYDPNAGDAVPGSFTDLNTVALIFDINTEWQTTPYRILYVDNANGTYSLNIDSVASGASVATTDISIAAGHTRARDAARQTLTLDFSLVFTNFPANGSLLSNAYLNLIDFSGISTGRILKVGTGNFLTTDTGYTGNAVNALDLWNGKDVEVEDVGYYVTNNSTTFCAQSNMGTAIGTIPELTASYAPANTGGWPNSVTDWNTATYYMPYYYYQSANRVTSFLPTDPDYYMFAFTTERFGTLVSYPTCRTTLNANRSISNIFLNGGVRVGDSGMGNRNLEVAFGLLPIAESWSQVVDGSFFANNTLTVNIEPLTCTTGLNCYFSAKSAATSNNGVLLANGALNIDVDAEDQIGSPQNWSAVTNGGNKPFTSFEINSYTEIKNYFEAGEYIEYTGNKTITDAGIDGVAILPDHTYFIDGNLTIDSATELRAAAGEYLLIVVNGNITLTENVKDIGAQSGVEAMLVALDNGTGTGNITIDDDAAETDVTDILTIEGALIAAGNIAFDRSLDYNNNTQAAVKIIFRPDMLGKMQTLNLGIIDIQKTLVSQN